jgi:hypothetical protein
MLKIEGRAVRRHEVPSYRSPKGRLAERRPTAFPNLVNFGGGPTRATSATWRVAANQVAQPYVRLAPIASTQRVTQAVLATVQSSGRSFMHPINQSASSFHGQFTLLGYAPLIELGMEMIDGSLVDGPCLS